MTEASVDPDEEVADLPPSAKLVHLVPQEHSRMTQSEVTEETRLAGRPVRDARLRGDGHARDRR